MFNVSGLMPQSQQVASMFASMRAGGGMGLADDLNRIQMPGGAPARTQLNMALQDLGKINADRGQLGYNMAGSQLQYDMQQRALQAQRQMQAQNSQFGSSMMMQLLSPFLSKLIGNNAS